MRFVNVFIQKSKSYKIDNQLSIQEPIFESKYQ